jgi:prepilin-type N-terminal cleavage/methylation domain-containing protein
MNFNRLPSKQNNGFTLIELMIVCAIGGIVVAIAFGAMNGNSVIPSKQSCLSQGGKWTEGYERGRMTQLCTYETK